MDVFTDILDEAWKHGGPFGLVSVGLAALNVLQFRAREKLHRRRLADARHATRVIIALVQRLARYERVGHERFPTIPDFEPEEEVTSVTIQRFERATEAAKRQMEPESVEELCREYLDGGPTESEPPRST